MSKANQTYAQVGVDIDIEAKAARILYEAAKQTWPNRNGTLGEVLVPFDDFAGLRYIDVGGLPKDTVMYGCSDGVATKAEFAERGGRYDTLAFDLMAMVCDDAVIRGGEPVAVKSVLDVNTLGQDEQRLSFIKQLAKGYVAAAREAGVAIINGELAQLNDRIGDMQRFHLEWSADLTWFAHKSRLITGYNVHPGDHLVALREEGLRCNGISLIRNILRQQYGDSWHETMFKGQRLIDLALRPSRIYTSAMVDMIGGYNLERPAKAVINGAAHISGGGIPEKLGRLLRASGFGARIDSPFTPCELMLHCQELGNVTDREAYRTWNMGNGMIIVTPQTNEVIAVAKNHGIEAKVMGTITKEPGIHLASKGFFAAHKPWIKF